MEEFEKTAGCFVFAASCLIFLVYILVYACVAGLIIWAFGHYAVGWW